MPKARKKPVTKAEKGSGHEPLPDAKPVFTDKQSAFCREYLRDFNATQAAIRAGYKENAARQTASDLLSKPDIQHYIQSLSNKMNERTDNDIERIICELQLIAFGSMRDVAEWSHLGINLKDSVAIGHSARLISEIKESKGKVESISVKLHDKLRALEMLGKYHKIFTDKIEVNDLSQKSDDELISEAQNLMNKIGRKS